MRILSWILAVAGVCVVIWDYFVSQAGALQDLGAHWFMIDPDSIQVLQPAVERHVSVSLWDWVVGPLLQTPTAAILFVLALIALLISGLVRAIRG